MAIDGLTYLAAAALLLRVKLPSPAPRTDKPSMLAELREGWAFFIGTTWLWVVVAAFCLICAVFGLGWNLAMQENVPDDMLSRAFSYDAIGSFIAVPIGQLAVGPLALAFGIEHVILVAGIALVVIALLTLLSRAVRDLPRAAVESATTV